MIYHCKLVLVMNIDGYDYWNRNCLPFRSNRVHPPVFSGDRVTRSLVLCVYFINRFIVLLSFFILPLCCQSCLDLQILITSLVSSNSSCSDYDDPMIIGLHLSMQKLPITTKVMSFIHAHAVVYSIELNDIKKSLKIPKG